MTRFATCLTAAWLGGGSQLACAQALDPFEERTPDLIVTAQKREEAPEQVPVSLTIVSEPPRQSVFLNSLDQLASLVPNLTFARQGLSGSGQLSMRGVYSSVGASTVTVYLDEVPVHMRPLDFAGAAAPAFVDIDRVEVLRGPQGTLFGASSLGGTVQFHTTKPKLDTWSGWARAGVSSVEGGSVGSGIGVAVGGPLARDALGVRAVYERVEDAGYVDRLDPVSGRLTEDVNTQSRATYRVSGRLETGPVRIDAFVHRQELEAADLPFFQQGDRSFEQSFAVPQPGMDDFLAASVTVTADFAFARLVMTGAALIRDYEQATDYSSLFGELVLGGAVPGFVLAGGTTSRVELAQDNLHWEARLQSPGHPSDIGWTAGISYSSSQLQFAQNVFDPGLEEGVGEFLGSTVTEIFGVPLLPGEISYFGMEQAREQLLAIFGQVDWKVSSGWALFAGLRATASEVALKVSSAGPYAGVAEPIEIDAVQSERFLTPRAGVSYTASPALGFYASVSRGFRPGGGNVPVPADACGADLAGLGRETAPAAYNSDSLWSYEAGFKYATPSAGTRISGAVFAIDWTRIQQAVQLPNCGFSYVDNLGSVRNTGFELEVETRLSRNILTRAHVGFVDARFVKDIQAAGSQLIVSAGDAVPFAPNWTANAAVEYRLPLNRSAIELHVRSLLGYTSEYRRTFGPMSVGFDEAIFRAEGYLHGALDLGISSGDWRANLSISNLFNARPVIQSSSALTPITKEQLRQTSLAPRTFALTVSHHF